MTADILVADDDPLLTALLADYLTGRQHRVTTAGDGFQLVRQAVENRPHLIITDVQMPGAYGPSVYQSLQKDPRTKDIPVLFISGSSYEKLKPILPQDPKTRFLHKPIVFAELDRLVSELLALGGQTA